MNRLVSWFAFAALSVGIVAGGASETSEPAPEQEPAPAVSVGTVDPQTPHACLPVVIPVCGGGQVARCTLDAWRCKHCGCSD
ncbi:hypothetical protein BH11MYX4_BH11MYX4_67790 [soil metagenome]